MLFIWLVMQQRIKKTNQEVTSLLQIFSLLWDKCSEETKAGYLKTDTINNFMVYQGQIKKENYSTKPFDLVIENMRNCTAANAQNIPEGNVNQEQFKKADNLESAASTSDSDARANPAENEGDLDKSEQIAETSSETSLDNVVLNNSSKDAEQDDVNIQAAQGDAVENGTAPLSENLNLYDEENIEIIKLTETIDTLDLEKVKTALEQDSMKAVASQWIQDHRNNGYPIFVHPVVVCLRDGEDLDNALKIKDEILKVVPQETQDSLPLEIMVGGTQYSSPENYFRIAKGTVDAATTPANMGETSPVLTAGNTTPEKSLPGNKKKGTVVNNAATTPANSNDTNFWSEHKGKIALSVVGLCAAGAIAAYVLAYPAVALALAVLAAVILMGAGIAKVLEDPSVEKPFTQREVHCHSSA